MSLMRALIEPFRLDCMRRLRPRLIQSLGWIVGLSGLAGPAAAVEPAASAVQQTERTEVQLISAAEGWRSQGPTWVGLRIGLAPEWHVYWRNPGDSGSAPRVTWALPEAAEAGDIHWPVPEPIRVGPLMNFGYSDSVILPVPVRVDKAATQGPVAVTAKAEWLVCKEACIPESGTFTLRLPVHDDPAPSPWASALDAARDRLPAEANAPVALVADDARLALDLTALERAHEIPRDTLWFFPEDYGWIDHAAPQALKTDASGPRLVLERGDLQGRLERLGGVLSWETETGRQGLAFDATADATLATGGIGGTELATSPPAHPPNQALGLAPALLFAILGGLILNLMPCVFPVLAFKALHLVEQAAGPRPRLRLQGLAYTAGVLVMFGVVAGLLLAIRAAGQEVGWGFQLQDPLVVSLLAVVMLLLGLMLSGVFELGGSLTGVGSRIADPSAARGGALTGAFLTGGLAVVVATPCTAPFMGAALGYALMQPPTTTAAVFLALGLGLALPFLVLSFLPQWARALPRPGLWMVRLKQFLAFPLYATAAWLVWVASQQVDAGGLAALLAALVLAALGAWLWGLTQQGGRTRRLRIGAIATLLLAGLVLRGVLDYPPLPEVVDTSGWDTTALEPQPYSPEALRAMRAEGHPVFVNLTAAWCITCLVNERSTLARPSVVKAFDAAGVTYMKGDWTNRDPQITRLLERYGRSGVPLYLLYPPEGKAQVLPQILSPKHVFNALQALEDDSVPG